MPEDSAQDPAQSTAPAERKDAAVPKPSSKAKLWTFLNSSFGVFVCSSIVLASLSFGYHQWTEYENDQRKIEQLDIEIGLRLKDMHAYAHLPDKNRYNNIENIQRVNEGHIQEQRDGEIRNLFWIRRPAFDEYKDKNTTSLMWQLYLLVPSSEQASIRQAIQQSIRIDRLLPDIRLKAASEPEPPPAKTKQDQDKQDQAENNLKKDFGQNELFVLISQLAENPRWRNSASEAGQ